MKKLFLTIVFGFCAKIFFAQIAPNYPTAPVSSGNITAMEYFIDANKNFGSGTALTGFTASANLNAFTGIANITGLPQGFHRFYLRSADISGKWSLTSNAYFDNYAVPIYAIAPATSGNITAMEYFIDANLNFGSGTPITGFASTPNVSGYTTTASLSGLSNGFHRFYIRSKDVSNKWSLTKNSFFDNYAVPIYATAPAASSNITAMEYFIDTKPEFGSGNTISGFTPAANISAFNTNASLTGVSKGFHRFYIRSKDLSDKWSLTNNVFFDNYNVPLYNTAPPSVTNIVKIEYFIDNNDLGFGNCTDIPVTANTNIALLNANINVTGLVQGVHRVLIRSKDATNKWSITNLSVFDNSSTALYPLAPASAPILSNMEYFIDTDPGFGNATPISVFGNSGNINNYNVNLNLSGSLSVGNHNLYIRSKQNPWSLTTIVPFSATTVLPLSWSYIKAELQNKNGLVSWGTTSEINAKEFVIEYSTNSINFKPIGTQLAAGNSSTNNDYTYTHVNLPAGINYYRIKQIDNDGRFTYSAIVTLVNKNGLKNNILAPNPASNYSMLILNKPAKNTILYIYNNAGQLMKKNTINNGLEFCYLDVSTFAKGKYLVEINNNGNKETITLIIN